MGITFARFMTIARDARAWNIVECWDIDMFNEYVNEFGPMTEMQARELCHLTNTVTDDELAAGDYFAW